jgi:hypothetical protein
MELVVVEEDGVVALEGQPEQPFVAHADEARKIIEACFERRAHAVLLYPPNLPAAFFDLSSGEAGSILQTLQNYHIRLAVVCPPGSATLSSRFSELLAEAQQSREFGLFANRAAARAWLAR